jgi:hypothetical protein
LNRILSDLEMLILVPFLFTSPFTDESTAF